MAGCLTDVTSHSVPDYALCEQNPRQGRVSPDPRRGWGGGQAARGQRRGSAAWRRTRGWASLQGVSFGARVSELRGAPNRSAASQRGPLTPPRASPAPVLRGPLSRGQTSPRQPSSRGSHSHCLRLPRPLPGVPFASKKGFTAGVSGREDQEDPPEPSGSPSGQSALVPACPGGTSHSNQRATRS